MPDAEPEDLLLFDDLLGIADPEVELPKIDPDARRRRLTALVNAASLARNHPAVYVVEDAHWIDEVSESMLADVRHGDPADALAGADHLPPRISGRVEPGGRCSDHRPCAAERFGDRSTGLRAARAGPLGWRVGRHDRREGRR